MLPFTGRNLCLPSLPCTPGEEGVGEVVEIGSQVYTVTPGNRVVLTSRQLGSWRYYGVYDQRDVHIVSPNIPLPEAAMLTIAPCTAYRMLKDFKRVKPGQSVIQNAANSPCGQSVIQLCKAWDINTYNIVANHCDCKLKEHLLSLGATVVLTLEEAEDLCSSATSFSKPVLGLNCVGGRYEDAMLNLLDTNATIIYHGSAFDMPMAKQHLRYDCKFYKFHLCDWNAKATPVERDVMLRDLVQLIVIGKFRAPLYEPIELKNYIQAFKNMEHNEMFSTVNYVFDFTLP